jgi:two-component system, NarL family, invasion response regulator UvrY
MTEGASILLIEDHPTVRMGLSMLLSRDRHWICGEAGNRKELLTALSLLEPDRPELALLDLSLGGEDGLDLIDVLRSRSIPVLIYSMHEDEGTVKRALAQGAQGYVCKRESSAALLAAVRDVLAGNRHISPLAAQNLSSPLEGVPQPSAASTNGLSEREQQILDLLGQGDRVQEIADKLNISTRTVETHCTRAIEKLDLNGMKALRRHAIQCQLGQTPSSD